MEQKEIVAIPAARPRCYLVYAIAPAGVNASLANKTINEFIGDPDTPLALWHDHILGDPGGCIVFYVENKDQQRAMFDNQHLEGWKVDYRPMVFSFSPSTFDAQISYTTNAYSDQNWESLKSEDRPDYEGRDIQQEAETAKES